MFIKYYDIAVNILNLSRTDNKKPEQTMPIKQKPKTKIGKEKKTPLIKRGR